MSHHYSYMEAVGNGFPTVQCHCPGDGSIYEDIVWDGGADLPTKSELDTWIASAVKLEMWRLIQMERDRRKAAGVKAGDNWFHSDDTSRIQQLGLVMFGSNMPANIMWKTLTGTFVQMTPTLALQIFQAVATSDVIIFTAAEQKRAQMEASPDPSDYDHLSGWPLSFGE